MDEVFDFLIYLAKAWFWILIIYFGMWVFNSFEYDEDEKRWKKRQK